MTRYETNIKVESRRVQHICKQPDIEAVKAKIKLAYPGKKIEFGIIEPAHSRLPSGALDAAA